MPTPVTTTDPLDAMTERERTLKIRERWARRFIIILPAIGIIIACLWPGFARLGRLLHLASMGLGAIAGEVVGLMFAARIRALNRQRVDDRLTHLAQGFARHHGLRIEKVRIDDGSDGRSTAFYVREANEIVVSQKLIDVMSPEEVAFLLASATMSPRQSYGISLDKPTLAMVAVFIWVAFKSTVPTHSATIAAPQPGISTILFSHWWAFPIGLVVIVAVLAAAAIGYYCGQDRNSVRSSENTSQAQFAADWIGLTLTQNREAAESALIKLTASDVDVGANLSATLLELSHDKDSAVLDRYMKMQSLRSDALARLTALRASDEPRVGSITII